MRSETQTRLDTQAETALEDWQIGTIGGLAGSILFGVLLSLQAPGVIDVAIPTLYGLEGGFAGTVVHLLHGVILGVVFVMLREAIGWGDGGLIGNTVAGVGYGIVVWGTLAVIVMPLWLSAVGFALGPDVPNVSAESFVGHVIYGLVVGVVYALLGE